MYQVSDAYKESMKSSLRERAYIMLSFGLVNQEAQAKAQIGEGAFTRYSNTKNIFGKKTDDTIYATLEENFTPVDGSMFFLPRGEAVGGYYDTGIVSRDLISNGEFSLTINLNIPPTDFRGLTINFGDNYPVDFDIVSDSGQRVEIRGNELSDFVTEEVFENTSSLTLVFYAMKNRQSRLRIYSIRFGYGLVYYNDSVMSSAMNSYVSPICADLPQIDFSVSLKNYDRYFNVDNPDSAIHFIETGQEMDVYYGYQLPSGEVEWIQGNHLLCSDWEADDYTATIRCTDVFRAMDTEFYQGMYTSVGKSYLDLAVEVLNVAGITRYELDPILGTLYTKNPIPRVKCKEALQIIANACRCVLMQSRTGDVVIKSASNVEGASDFTVTKHDMTSSPKAIKQERVKEVIVPCYSYQAGSSDESLVKEDVSVLAGDEMTFVMSTASHGYKATLNSSTTNVTIVASGDYYVTVLFKKAGSFTFELTGRKYIITERQVMVRMNERGKTVKWDNPLISDMDMAMALAEWIADYHAAGIEYEYTTRGNPELDTNDIIRQENEFRGDMKVRVYRSTLNFDQSFSGRITARRLEEWDGVGNT